MSDAVETGRGSNPTNPADVGTLAPDGARVNLKLTVGDSSGSESERWAIIAANPTYGNMSYTAPGWGQVGTREFPFRTGQSYNITLKHLDTRPDFLTQWGVPVGSSGDTIHNSTHEEPR